MSGIDDTLAAPGTSPSPAPSETVSAQRLAERYEILGLLGAGGMGSVYKARDVELDELVALKALRRDALADAGAIERFRQEVKLARRVTHRNVARTFDIGEHAGERFLTMEFVDGESLGSMLARMGPPGLDRLTEIGCEICEGLHAAHAAGVIHRDLKPENVLIERGGRVVITDFGIAHAQRESAAERAPRALVGTPAYMAPEQVEGGALDARTDLYALGAVLYEMITGAQAWAGDQPLAVAAARLAVPPPDPRARRPGLPAAYAEMVLRCMAREPAHRFATAREAAAALLEAQGSSHQPHASAGVSVRPPRMDAPPAGKAVAVLPLRSLGAEEDRYLAEGLTDDLIDALSNRPGLRVRSRSMVLAIGGLDRDPRALGAELGVQVVVEGSVERSGELVRIRVRVSSVADGFQLFAKRFDRPASALLAVNDELVNAVASALVIELGGKGRGATSDPAAVDLYLRARAEYRRFWGSGHAVELFEQALQVAPADPVILSSLAAACVRRSFVTGGDESVRLAERARDAAERAIAVGSGLGDPHLALASVLFQEGDAVAAALGAREAIARAPGLAEAHALFGRILSEAKDTERGMRHLQIALDLDGHVSLARGDLARLWAVRGDSARVDQLLETRGFGPVDFQRMRFAYWRGDPVAARRGLELVAAMPVPYGQAISAAARAALEIAHGGRTSSLQPELDAALVFVGPTARQRAAYFQVSAEILVYAGDLDHAIRMVEGSVDADLIDLTWLDGCPLLAPLRGEPRFAAARARVVERVERLFAALR